MFLQMLAVGVICCVIVAYSRAGKDLMRGYQSSIAATQLSAVATWLDTFATDETDDSGGQGSTGFLYPPDYQSFCDGLAAEYPNKGERAWKDYWGTDLQYQPGLWQGTPGYYLASAGPDKQWRTEDDLWVCRWGEKRWSQNMGWDAAPGEEQPQEPAAQQPQQQAPADSSSAE
jgi:hypothetical protein